MSVVLMTASEVVDEFFTNKKTGRPIISKRKVYRLAHASQIPALKVDGRWVFNRDAIIRWLSCDEFFTKRTTKNIRAFDVVPIDE